jgi:hypothetical protein
MRNFIFREIGFELSRTVSILWLFEVIVVATLFLAAYQAEVTEYCNTHGAGEQILWLIGLSVVAAYPLLRTGRV